MRPLLAEGADSRIPFIAPRPCDPPGKPPALQGPPTPQRFPDLLGAPTTHSRTKTLLCPSSIPNPTEPPRDPFTPILQGTPRFQTLLSTLERSREARSSAELPPPPLFLSGAARGSGQPPAGGVHGGTPRSPRRPGHAASERSGRGQQSTGPGAGAAAEPLLQTLPLRRQRQLSLSHAAPQPAQRLCAGGQAQLGVPQRAVHLHHAALQLRRSPPPALRSHQAPPRRRQLQRGAAASSASS